MKRAASLNSKFKVYFSGNKINKFCLLKRFKIPLNKYGNQPIPDNKIIILYNVKEKKHKMKITQEFKEIKEN